MIQLIEEYSTFQFNGLPTITAYYPLGDNQIFGTDCPGDVSTVGSTYQPS